MPDRALFQGLHAISPLPITDKASAFQLFPLLWHGTKGFEKKRRISSTLLLIVH